MVKFHVMQLFLYSSTRKFLIVTFTAKFHHL